MQGLATREAAEAALKTLAANGIADVYVMPGSDPPNVLSLGVFSDYQRAQRRVDEVRAIGLTPRIDDRKRAGSVYWIDVDLQEPGQLIDTSIFQSDPRQDHAPGNARVPGRHGGLSDPARRIASKLRPFLLDLGALALIVLAPFVVLLSFHGYSYFTPEVLLILASALVIAALLAVLIGFAGRLVRAVVLAGLIALFIDMHVSLPPWSFVRHRTPVPRRPSPRSRPFSGCCTSMRPRFSASIFVTLIATDARARQSRLASDRQRADCDGGSGNAEPPLLIHLLLDEHIGVEGLPPEIPGTRALRPELIEFYTSRGFRLFGGAYSQYANTFNSIANLLNFASREVSHPYLPHGSREAEWQLKKAAYFQHASAARLSAARVPIHYMDLCHADGVQLQECTTYPVTSLGMLQGLGLRAAEKARAIANAIVTQSKVLRVVNKVYERVIRGTLLRAGWQTAGVALAGAAVRSAART